MDIQESLNFGTPTQGWAQHVGATLNSIPVINLHNKAWEYFALNAYLLNTLYVDGWSLRVYSLNQRQKTR
jgi:hypothetical protein